MEAMHSLDVSDVGLLLPGVTSCHRPRRRLHGRGAAARAVRVHGQGQRNHFVPQGDIVDFEGTTADITPEGLING